MPRLYRIGQRSLRDVAAPAAAAKAARYPAVLAVMSRDATTVAALLVDTPIPALGRTLSEWAEALRTTADEFAASVLPSIRLLESHPCPPMRTDDSAVDAHTVAKARGKREGVPQVDPLTHITVGPYNVLLHFVLHVPHTHHIVFPLTAPPSSPSPAPASLVLSHLIHNFTSLTARIRAAARDLADFSADANGAMTDAPAGVTEYGVRVAESSEGPGPGYAYWVVGVFLPDGRECFVCHDAALPQTPTDIALRLFAGLG